MSAQPTTKPAPFGGTGEALKPAQSAVARIVSVSGAQAVALLDRTAYGVGSKDRIEIGSLLKIVTHRSSVVGVVSGISSPYPESDPQASRIGLVEVNLAGEIRDDLHTGRRAFHRGVTSLPSIGDPVLMPSHEDLGLVYAPPDSPTIEIGHLFQDPTVPARLLIDELFGKHFIIVGTTGCGKSSGLACILQSVLIEHRHAHVVILDIHNEYTHSFGDKAELIEPANLRLPFWLLNFQELTSALTSNDEHHDAEIEILTDAVLVAKRRYSDALSGRLRRSNDTASLTVDTPSPFRLSDIVAVIDEHLGRLERAQGTLPYRRLKARIEALVNDARYSFMFGALMIEDTMLEILGRLFRIPIDGKPVTVINLSAVPVEILDVVISVISRLAFDVAMWSENGLPIVLVCEEAHRYVPAELPGKFLPTRAALARIAKEGRKYGVSLALVTQRPSELDPTILSQCSTAIAMRLSTDRDQQVMRANTYDGALDLLDFLPLLDDREAIILGRGVVMPMRVRFRDIAQSTAPKSNLTGFADAWKTQQMTRESLDGAIRRWRLSVRSKAW